MWRIALELDSNMQPSAGDADVLRRALVNGADLRIASTFYHDEHVDTDSQNHELVEETMDMRVTYVVDDRWCAGVQSLRQPVELPDRFGARPSLSLFLYNQNGLQSIARPYLDGPPRLGPTGPFPPLVYPKMPKYREFERYDDATNAPSSNFQYTFEQIQFLASDVWQLALHHASDGTVLYGSPEALRDASRRGCEIKVGVRGLCDDLWAAAQEASSAAPVRSVDAYPAADQGDQGRGLAAPLPHEVFVHAGSHYYYTSKRWMIVGTHPLPRIEPAAPMIYRSRNWDYAWLIVRSDGHVALTIYDPYTLLPRHTTQRCEVRWFTR